MNNLTFLFKNPLFYIPFLIWISVWKGLALWKSATKKQLLWFILILVINTSGLLEIIYFFFLNRRDIDNGRTLKFLEKRFQKSKK